MTLLLAYQNRNFTRDITILDAAGVAVTPTANDRVKAQILRLGGTIQFSIDSDAPSANGSSFTKGSPCRLRLDASDLDAALIKHGIYTMEILYFDMADSQEWKVVDRQCFCLERTS